MEGFDFGSLDLEKLIEQQAEIDRKNAEAERKRQAELQEELEAAKRKREEARRPRPGGPGGQPEPKKPIEVVTFDDIIGMEDSKREMEEAVILPMTYGAVYERYKKRPVKGCLLYGPPGNGKTLLGKALAQRVATLAGKGYVEDAFQYFSCTEFLNMYVGQTEANIRRVFEGARRFLETHGYRQVVFFDEPDIVFAKRGTVGGGGSSAVNEGAVTTMLTELDGLKQLGAFVIIATNRPERLDDALVRPGRIDRKVFCPRPTEADVRLMFEHYLGKTCVENVGDVAEAAVGAFRHPGRKFMTVHTDSGDVDFGLWDIRSGAMIAGLVDQAVGNAIMRDIESSRESGVVPEGFVTKEDIIAAIEKEFRMSQNLNHEEALGDLLGDRKPMGVTRNRRS